MNDSKTLPVAGIRDLITGQEGELIESTYQSVAGVEDIRFVLRLPDGAVVDRHAHEVARICGNLPQLNTSRTLQSQRKRDCDLPAMAPPAGPKLQQKSPSPAPAHRQLKTLQRNILP
jgi:hypothetical protein